MEYILAALMIISLFVCLTLGAMMTSDLITLDRYKIYCENGFCRDFYGKEYEKRYRKYKRTVRYFFIWLVILIINKITGYSIL